MLVEALQSWPPPSPIPGDATADIPLLAEAAVAPVRANALVVHEDPLHGDQLNPLTSEHAVAAIRDPLNWWRGEDERSPRPAQSVFVLSITDGGREEMARLGRAPLSS